MEEVRAERGLDLKVGEVGLDDRPNGRDLRPGDRDAQPRVARAPPAGSNENRLPTVAAQLSIDALDQGRGLGGLRAVHPPGIDDHQVRDRLAPAVAECDLGPHDRPVGHRVVDLHFDLHVFEHHRPQLQHVEGLEVAGTGLDVDGELELGGARETLPARLQKPAEDLGQWHDAPAQKGVEGDERRAARLDARHHAVVDPVIG